MASVLDHMTSAVARIKSVRESVIFLLNSLAEKVRNGSNDPVALESIATALENEASIMADAVVAATPVAPSGLGAGPVAAPPERFVPVSEPIAFEPEPVLVTADSVRSQREAAAAAQAEQDRVRLAEEQKASDEAAEARRIAEATTSDL